MKIEITRVTSWIDVLNAARFTQKKELLGDKHEPSDAFKKRIILAEHSPLRCLMFNIDLYDIPYYVSVHLCRHVHAQPFVSTSRPDILATVPEASASAVIPREEQKKSDPVNVRLFLNAQEIINISKARLCNKAEFETRSLWHDVITELEKTEPLLAKACVPNCIYRGFCPEFKHCGFCQSSSFAKARTNYINNLSD